jgi:hypothetical protein
VRRRGGLVSDGVFDNNAISEPALPDVLCADTIRLTEVKRRNKVSTRLMLVMGVAWAGLALTGGPVLAQPTPAVPHDQVTPSRYKQHPRPVPEPQTIDALNAMSLDAARKGVSFTPPAPGTEHGTPAKP